MLFGSVVIFGAERGNLQALMALKEQGAKILCLVSDEAWNQHVPPALDARGIVWRKVPYVHIGRGLSWATMFWHNPLRLIRANRAFLKAVREFKPTHIHAYGQSFVANFLPGLSLTRTPMVFRAGDEPTVHNTFWRATWRFVAGRTSRFVANSRFVADALQRHGVAANRISLIYNAPPARPGLERVRPSEPALDQQVVVYVGQIAEHKGPHLLVEAFRDLMNEFPNARLLLAGRIHDEWEGDQWARDLRDKTSLDATLGDRVQFLGSVEAIPALLARSSFVTVPSLFDDPAPNVVIEAKQAGRAVIAFPRGGIPELIEHEADGLVCAAATVSALVVALRRYLAEPDLARRHGAAGRRSLERLGIPQFGPKWRDVYRAAVLPSGHSAVPEKANAGSS